MKPRINRNGSETSPLPLLDFVYLVTEIDIDLVAVAPPVGVELTTIWYTPGLTVRFAESR